MSQHMAVELLSSYLDEEVTQAQLRLVENHLSGCSECRGTLAGLSSIAASVRRLEAVTPPSTLAPAVERRVRLAALEEPRRLRFEEGLRRWLGQPVLAPVFAIVLALGAILYLFALGVSELEQRRTRLVVATAPAQEDRQSSERLAGELELESAAPRADASAPAPARPDPDRSGVGGARSRVSPPRTPAISEGRELESRLERVPVEAEMAEKAEVADTVETARVAVNDPAEPVTGSAAGPPADSEQSVDPEAAGRRTLAAVEPARKSADEVWADDSSPRRILGGREFVEQAGVWVEVGLEGQSAAELVDLRTGIAGPDEDLAAFRDLQRVRLRIGDRIVEVIYPLERRE